MSKLFFRYGAMNSGKIAELAVRKIIHGEPVGNQDALANPGALSLYAALPELSVD